MDNLYKELDYQWQHTGAVWFFLSGRAAVAQARSSLHPSRKFNNFQISWKLSQAISVPFVPDLKFLEFLVEWKAPRVVCYDLFHQFMPRKILVGLWFFLCAFVLSPRAWNISRQERMLLITSSYQPQIYGFVITNLNRQVRVINSLVNYNNNFSQEDFF